MDELKLTSHHIPSSADHPPEGQKRFKMVIEYDGTAYSGWQRQINGPSVQQTLEEALARLTARGSAWSAQAGRTRAFTPTACGAHFDSATRVPPEKICFALNTMRRRISAFEIACLRRKDFTRGFPRAARSIDIHSAMRGMPAPSAGNIRRMRRADGRGIDVQRGAEPLREA